MMVRDNPKFHVQRRNSNSLRNAFSHRASILWNNLPVLLKNKPSLEAFKAALKINHDNVLDRIRFNGMQESNRHFILPILK